MANLFGPKALTKLQQKKYRSEYGCFFVEGKKGVLDAVQSNHEVMQLVVTGEFFSKQQAFFSQPEIAQFVTQQKVLQIDEATFARFSDTSTPPGIAAVVRIPDVQLQNIAASKKLIAVLEDVRDPGNLGTMLRTADWFNVGGVILLGGADPYQPKVVRSSMGSIFHVPILRVESESSVATLQALKELGYQVVVTRPELSPAQASALDQPQQVAVVFGNESRGTSSEVDALADAGWSIPRYGSAESLNVAVSFGIALFALRSQ